MLSRSCCMQAWNASFSKGDVNRIEHHVISIEHSYFWPFDRRMVMVEQLKMVDDAALGCFCSNIMRLGWLASKKHFITQAIWKIQLFSQIYQSTLLWQVLLNAIPSKILPYCQCQSYSPLEFNSLVHIWSKAMSSRSEWSWQNTECICKHCFRSYFWQLVLTDKVVIS